MFARASRNGAYKQKGDITNYGLKNEALSWSEIKKTYVNSSPADTLVLAIRTIRLSCGPMVKILA